MTRDHGVEEEAEEFIPKAEQQVPQIVIGCSIRLYLLVSFVLRVRDMSTTQVNE
jgi:hypothetical protein